MRTGIAIMPLDYGICPRWLFERMRKLARGIIVGITEEFGPDEILKRFSDPIWFQSFGCTLAFDWNSSGLTTTTLGAVKSALFGIQDELGIYICGGKGRTSRKTPQEIEMYGTARSFSFVPNLIYASRMAAKVDSALIQDNYQIYHHNFIFTKSGDWVVVQQGLNADNQTARRYHWLSSKISDFTEEPHTGISSNIKVKPLNLTAKQSKKNKEISAELVTDGYRTLISDLEFIKEKQTGQRNLFKTLEMPDDTVLPQLTGDLDFTKSKYLNKILFQVHEKSPANFEQVLMSEGVGPMTIRALSLVSELIYGAKPSYEDPARYSFAMGGKDGVPFFVNRRVYDKTLDVIEKGIKKSDISRREKEKALRRFTESLWGG